MPETLSTKAFNITTEIFSEVHKAYRFGFNGFERDDEIKGSGNWYSFGDYGYDSRIVQRPSPDPMAAKYPAFSPYAAFGNNPILFIDKEGKEIWISDPNTGKSYLYVPNETAIREDVNDFVKTVSQTLDKITTSGMDDKFNIVKTLAYDNTNTSITQGQWNEHLGATLFSDDKGLVYGKIPWSPQGGAVVEEGVRHSPAHGLLHELAHVFYEKYDPTGEVAGRPDANLDWAKRIIYEDEQIRKSGKYENPADKWIIEEVEPPTGEPIRTEGHGANYIEEFKASDPFSLEGQTKSELE